MRLPILLVALIGITSAFEVVSGSDHNTYTYGTSMVCGNCKSEVLKYLMYGTIVRAKCDEEGKCEFTTDLELFRVKDYHLNKDTNLLVFNFDYSLWDIPWTEKVNWKNFCFVTLGTCAFMGLLIYISYKYQDDAAESYDEPEIAKEEKKPVVAKSLGLRTRRARPQ